MKKLLFCITVPLILAMAPGCKKDSSGAGKDTPADLRIYNATAWTFYDCTIDPSGTLSDYPGPNAYNYGQIDVNARSAYKTFTNLHRYSWVRLTMNNRTYYLKPYDYTGEVVLASGQYTYKLTYTSFNDQLNLELIKD